MTTEKESLLVVRLTKSSRKDAQDAANKRFDGNLSMFVRQAIREAAQRVKKEASK